MSTAVPARRYGTPADVRALVAAHPDRPAGTAAELDDTVLLARLATGTGHVDAALAGAGRVVPGIPTADGLIADAPVIVRDVAVAIAAYLADLTYRETRGHNDQSPVLARYQWALGLLEAWTAGKALPPGLEQPEDPEQGDISIGTPVNPGTPILFDERMLAAPYRHRGGGYDPDWWR